MSTLARRYAMALYRAEVREETLLETCEAVMGMPQLWEALTSPAFRIDEKKAVLTALPMLEKTPEILRFFLILADEGRMKLLPDVLEEFHGLTLAAQDSAQCIVTSAKPLTQEQLAQISQKLCQLHHKSNIVLVKRFDPELLGGFTLEIEGVTYDQSIKGRLKNLSRYLEEVSTT